MELCLGFTVACVLFGLPIPLCWTGAVLFARVLRDLPVSPRRAGGVLLDGIQLALAWMIVPGLITLFAGGLGGLLYLPFVGPEEEIESALLKPALLASLIANAGGVYFLLWPVTREDWRRLTR